MAYYDLREFMEACDKAGEMVTIDKELDWNLEVGAISRRICEIGAPMAHMTNICGISNGSSILASPMAKGWQTDERLVVRALVGEPGSPVEGGDELWVLDWVEARMEQPWSIKVLEELDEDDAEAARSDVTEADKAAAAEESKKYGGKRYRGSELPDAMGQEEARKYYENLVGKGSRK